MSIGIIVAGVSALISVIAVAVSLKTAAEQRGLSRQLAVVCIGSSIGA